METTNHPPKALKGAIVSITTYLILSVLKVFFGYVFESEAVLADGFNNTTDIIASIAVYIGIRVAAIPRDAEHKYGHAKMETIAALVASLIMVAVGVVVLLNGISNLLAGEYTEPNPLAAVVAFGSALVMFGVYRYNSNLAKKTKSLALKAAAKDNFGRCHDVTRCDTRRIVRVFPITVDGYGARRCHRRTHHPNGHSNLFGCDASIVRRVPT